MTERYDALEMQVERPLRRFTVDEYERMGELGILRPDDRVELIEGVIVEMAAIGSRHAGTVNRMNRLLVLALGDRYVVCPQNPIRLPPWSEPEPDLLVARPRPDDYAGGHPESGDTLLCIEVSDTTLREDRAKTRVYARNGVPEAWIVNLPGGVVEVYRDPGNDGYETREVAEPGADVAPAALPDLRLAVTEMLPQP